MGSTVRRSASASDLTPFTSDRPLAILAARRSLALVVARPGRHIAHGCIRYGLATASVMAILAAAAAPHRDPIILFAGRPTEISQLIRQNRRKTLSAESPIPCRRFTLTNSANSVYCSIIRRRSRRIKYPGTSFRPLFAEKPDRTIRLVGCDASTASLHRVADNLKIPRALPKRLAARQPPALPGG